METKRGFTLMNRQEFQTWLQKQIVSRSVRFIQNHHTFVPDYSHFKNDHFSNLAGMRTFHMTKRGFSDIAQHFTTFPDGLIGTGRPLAAAPAGILGNNSEAICVEHLGNFNDGADQMSAEHRDTIIWINAVLCHRFNLRPSTDSIVYHHWFDLNSGLRTGGLGSTKTCPGSGFFGGNSVAAAEQHFLPLIRERMRQLPAGPGIPPEKPRSQGWVNALNLNVRKGPDRRNGILTTLALGTIVPVFELRNGWARVSSAPQPGWASKRFLLDVTLGRVVDNDPAGLNVRSGPSVRARRLRSLPFGAEVTVFEKSPNNWLRIGVLDEWVSGSLVELLGE